MALSVPAFGPADPDEALATVNLAIDMGCNFFDTAIHYGDGKNEKLIATAAKGRRDSVIIASKFGTIVHPDGSRSISGKLEIIAPSLEKSLKNLNTDYLDLLLMHRVDPDTPIEETVGAMAKLVEQGKLRHIGLCEAAPATLRRACAVHQLTVLQTEYSLWSRHPEEELFSTCQELGIGFVAYSPLGHGFLAGAVKDRNVLGEKDTRQGIPRFQEGNFEKNLGLLETVEEVAAAKGATTAQIALAWVMAQGNFIVPIPGTRRRTNLEENIEAADITLHKSDLDRLDQAFMPAAIAGERWSAGQMERMNK